MFMISFFIFQLSNFIKRKYSSLQFSYSLIEQFCHLLWFVFEKSSISIINLYNKLYTIENYTSMNSQCKTSRSIIEQSSFLASKPLNPTSNFLNYPHKAVCRFVKVGPPLSLNLSSQQINILLFQLESLKKKYSQLEKQVIEAKKIQKKTLENALDCTVNLSQQMKTVLEKNEQQIQKSESVIQDLISSQASIKSNGQSNESFQQIVQILQSAEIKIDQLEKINTNLKNEVKQTQTRIAQKKQQQESLFNILEQLLNNRKVFSQGIENEIIKFQTTNYISDLGNFSS